MSKRSGRRNFVSSVERAGRMSKLSPECSHRAGQLAETTLGEYIAAWGSHNSKIPSTAFSSGKGERAGTFQVNGCKSGITGTAAKLVLVRVSFCPYVGVSLGTQQTWEQIVSPPLNVTRFSPNCCAVCISASERSRFTLRISGGAENKVTAAMEPRVICVVVLVFTLALSSLAQGQLETCDVDPHKRSNCGFSGITPSQCKDKGCCFDNTVRGVPWCFRPEPVDNPPEEECSL
ncbi:trefoil factor 1 isoform X2 [Hyaena hyaena]|uniref:trefoil factor 1 isoform X2 n=1 Tax=Hyaena hyaena TaxID=95912 RepID=UPI001922234F|nr:trefoil factor 1 isoform X2 [Hyaena hyaena]